MSGHAVMHFQNDAGHKAIRIGVKEFMCCGASSPYDHPHVYLDMGDDGEIVCPYCSTLFQYEASLRADETQPEGCLFEDTTVLSAPANA